MELVYIVEEGLGNTGSRERMLQPNEMGIPRKEIDDHQDTAEAHRQRKALDEIQGNQLPGSVW